MWYAIRFNSISWWHKTKFQWSWGPLKCKEGFRIHKSSRHTRPSPATLCCNKIISLHEWYSPNFRLFLSEKLELTRNFFVPLDPVQCLQKRVSVSAVHHRTLIKLKQTGNLNLHVPHLFPHVLKASWAIPPIQSSSFLQPKKRLPGFHTTHTAWKCDATGCKYQAGEWTGGWSDPAPMTAPVPFGMN